MTTRNEIKAYLQTLVTAAMFTGKDDTVSIDPDSEIRFMHSTVHDFYPDVPFYNKHQWFACGQGEWFTLAELELTEGNPIKAGDIVMIVPPSIELFQELADIHDITLDNAIMSLTGALRNTSPDTPYAIDAVGSGVDDSHADGSAVQFIDNTGATVVVPFHAVKGV